MRADEALPGDVVMDPGGAVYKAPDAEGVRAWGQIQIEPFLGDVPPGPDGDLTLLVRNGQPVAPPGLLADLRLLLAAADPDHLSTQDLPALEDAIERLRAAAGVPDEQGGEPLPD
jgi:hypothetical protein